MRLYTYSQARRSLASVLDKAKTEGQAVIRRKDGSLFVIKPVRKRRSPLDVGGVKAGISASEIVEIVREGRERYYSGHKSRSARSECGLQPVRPDTA